MTWERIEGKGSKSSLIRVFNLLGLSFRKGERGLNALLEIITEALDRGEVVDIPGGTLQCRTVQRTRRRQWLDLVNANTKKRTYKLVLFPGGPERRFLFRPDPELHYAPLPAPAPPLPVASPSTAPPVLTWPREMVHGFSTYTPWANANPAPVGGFWDNRLRSRGRGFKQS